jgi:glycosyltransferase involved in cell wall biosynthesis
VNHYRGVDITLRAIAKANVPNLEYIHCCGGPGFEEMRQLARELGVDSQVTWTGETPHAENIKTVATGDLYIHCTLRDNQGATLEALAMGIPCIAFDHNSSALMVRPECGFLLEINDQTTPEQVVDQMAAVFQRVHDDPGVLIPLGQQAIEHSKQFSHAHRGQWFRALYARLMETRTPTVKSKGREQEIVEQLG